MRRNDYLCPKETYKSKNIQPMSTETEKMERGDMYLYTDDEITESFRRARRLCARLQTMTIWDEAYREVISQLIPCLPATVDICPPFICDYGGNHIRIGEHVFINSCCVFIDGGTITIGDNTLLGPHCQLLATNHPLDYIARRKPQERGLPITIGNDCWLGGNVTVCPGVTIGDRTIIAAGSVVKHDMPSDCLAAGNPATVRRRLNGK